MTAGSGAADAGVVLRGLPSSWKVVHDGSTPGTADADHVVVGPGGIFLVSVRDRPSAEYTSSRDDDILACSSAADVVAEMSGAYARRVRPVLCILGDAEVLEQAKDVIVCSPVTLATALTSAPVVLAAAQCDEAVTLLGGEPADPAPRGKRARPVEPDSEPEPTVAPLAAQHEEPRGKRARVVEPEPEPELEPAAVVSALPPMSVPMITPRSPPPPSIARTEPVEVVAANPAPEPEPALTGRAKRVAEAMATRDAHAAKLAELQGKDGSAAKKPKGKRKVAKILRLLVAAAIVGVLALNGPHLVSTAGTWGPDLWAQLNGKSGSASACAPVAAAPSPATPKAAASRATGKKATGKKATAKASRSRASRKADARAKRRHHEAAATARTPALETPVC
ncbi:MAG: hypothetical protein ABIQ59_17800 [Nocardioidaceae bacterium]